jgi:hypothetical protein
MKLNDLILWIFIIGVSAFIITIVNDNPRPEPSENTGQLEIKDDCCYDFDTLPEMQVWDIDDMGLDYNPGCRCKHEYVVFYLDSIGNQSNQIITTDISYDSLSILVHFK